MSISIRISLEMRANYDASLGYEVLQCRIRSFPDSLDASAAVQDLTPAALGDTFSS